MNLEAYRYQFRKVLPELPKISLLGIRQYIAPYNSGVTNMYDDSIVRCIDGQLKSFTASVDPGKYYIDHPVNPQGCAKLKCGFWKYKIGYHQNVHKALVQADEVGVDRISKTGKRIGEEHGHFGINIHSGGPEYLIGRYSAGCQIIKTTEAWKDQWLDFFSPIVNGVETFNQKIIPYLLVDSLEAIPVPEPLGS